MFFSWVTHLCFVVLGMFFDVLIFGATFPWCFLGILGFAWGY